MAETDITITQFQTELGRVKTAIRARDWDSAHAELACAEITLSGIEKKIGDAGTAVEYRDQLEGARRAIEKAKEGLSKNSTNGRIAFARTTFSGRQHP